MREAPSDLAVELELVVKDVGSNVQRSLGEARVLAQQKVRKRPFEREGAVAVEGRSRRGSTNGCGHRALLSIGLGASYDGRTGRDQDAARLVRSIERE